MFKQLFTRSPLIDENSQQWIIDTTQWAIETFDKETFLTKTRLILPNNDFYPGRVSSVDEMANNIFNHTLNYANMEHWPIKLINASQMLNKPFPQLQVANGVRGSSSQIATLDGEPLSVYYHDQQVNQPQDLIASYAQQLASILFLQQKVLPPGGKECVPQAIDVIACFMGFGVMFANTAYRFRGGCGSCYNAAANRQAALPENEMLYCLALFAQLKGIAIKEINPQLKSHLRSNFKRMYKEIAPIIARSNQLKQLSVQ